MDDFKNIFHKELTELKETDILQKGAAGVRKEVAELKKELIQRGTSWILAGFGVIAGLAWNEAIKSLFDLLFGPTKASLMAKFLYAIFVTLIAVIITRRLGKLIDEATKEKSLEGNS